ncbi:energy transducer TonB [Mucilaginibacter sp.]
MKLFINAYLYYLMATEINNIKLKFNCPANWEEMQQLDGCRFCSHCQKKVYDFTGSTQAEFKRVLSENRNRVCGRFTLEQAKANLHKTDVWRRLLSAAVMVLGLGLFTNQAVAQKTKPKLKHKKVRQIKFLPPQVIMGDVDSLAYNDDDETLPTFPGGQDAMTNYFKNTIHYPKNISEVRVIVQFTVSPIGKLEDIKLIKGLVPDANQEVIKALKASPKWIPGTRHNKPVSVVYTLPIKFEK